MRRVEHLDTRPLPVGAELAARGVRLRVWAPERTRVVAVLEPDAREVELTRESTGYFSGVADGAGAGTRYRFRLDDDETLYPDPASRYQPEGPHGPSEVVDSTSFSWNDDEWRGITLPGQVVYEMHIGTFTEEGTWRAAAGHLGALADIGITCIEMMPVADFAGTFGWGYDGVDLFAPTRLYGEPDDLRQFIDEAHRLGLGVILDVVYNHLGPDGNYLAAFSKAYFTDRHRNEWGAAINFDGPDAGPVREFFIENAAYWIREYHFDGLRLDATQAIVDTSPDHILAALARRVREEASPRNVILIAENESQHAYLVRAPGAGGYGLDALWNDDLHHTLVVAATGRREAYYSDHAGTPQELISAVKWGYLLQGQYYAWQQQPRGTPALDLPPPAFVAFLENHDQVANSARGQRLSQLTTPGRLRALTALVLLAPSTPMLFQGQEFGSTRPFLFFADHEPALAGKVAQGRREFLAQFPSIASPDVRASLPTPSDRDTFRQSVLDDRERHAHTAQVQLHRDLLSLRRQTRAFSAQAWRAVDGAVLAAEAFVLRFFDGAPGAASGPPDSIPAGDRLLVVNLGRDLDLAAAPEPLLAPPAGCRWVVDWSSEAQPYGGSGTPRIDTGRGWHIPGHSAAVLRPAAADPDTETQNPA
jgi:maltooligosyltrehalose trehalohydrolase